MKIQDLLKPASIIIHADVETKEQAIAALIDKHDEAGNLTDKEVYTQGILKRESEGTTAIGEGIAIPHCKSDAVCNPGLAAMTVPGGIDYNAPDGQPSNLVFMIAAPMDGDLHLEVLARLMTLLMDLNLRKELLAAKTGEEFLEILNKAEAAKFPEEAEAPAESPAEAAAEEAAEGAAVAAAEAAESSFPRILAVTACPTGIAHTYMAAEALNQKAEEMGISIKVETNGSGGAKNLLTAEEIAAAEGIIVAADKQVAMARFAGKKVYKTKVADGINKPEELINKALSDSCPVYEASAEAAAEESADPAAKEKMESAAEEKAEGVEKTAADSEKTFAEKVVGRYTCADGDSEVYVLELMNVHGNLYAKAGIAMADDSEGADSAAGAGGAQASFPETYSFWAMELIPKDAGALLRTDTEEAEVGILSFSIMSNMSKYWSSPEKAILRLTDDGVVIASAKQGDGGEEAFREYKRWPDASAAVADPGIVSVNTDTPGLDGLDGTEIPDELYGLWKEKDSGSPYVLEFLRTESGKEKNRGILRIWRKKPGAEVYLSDEAFLCTPQEKADGAQDPKDGKAGVLHASGTVLGNGDMPTMWEDCFVLKDGILTFPAKSGGAGFYESPFSGGQDTVFERAEETDIPLSQLAEADDVSAIRHELKAETPAGTRAAIPQFLASEDVENNGGNFLRVGDLVFFRDVREGLDGVSALWGDFLDVPELAEGSKVMYYDRRTGETGTAFEDGGYGSLWYLDGRFYSGEPAKNADENYSGQSLHRCWPDGSGMENISEGNYASVTGASGKNDYLSVHQYVGGQEQYLVFDGSVYPA